MQMQWLKGEEKEKHRLSESQCYAKERGKVWCVCKHITEFFVSLQARDAKLTPQYSLISVKMGQLHELLAPPAGKLSFYLPLFWTIKHLSVISGVSLYSVKCTVLCEVGCWIRSAVSCEGFILARAILLAQTQQWPCLLGVITPVIFAESGSDDERLSSHPVKPELPKPDSEPGDLGASAWHTSTSDESTWCDEGFWFPSMAQVSEFEE